MFEFLPLLLKGAIVTIQVTVMSSAFAIIIGLLFGLAKISKKKLIRVLATIYIEFFRGTSLLVQLFWLFFVLPQFGLTLSPLMAAVLGIGLNYSAYGAEIVRGAILSVPKVQHEACIALNIAPFNRMRRIIFPQALITMIPPWGNLLIELLKATSLVSLITLHDLAFFGHSETIRTFKTLQILSLVLFIYYVIGRGGITPLIRYLEKRLNRGRTIGGVS